MTRLARLRSERGFEHQCDLAKRVPNENDLTLDALGLPLKPIDPGDAMRIDIAAEFDQFGQHPYCFRCRKPCKQYAAPDSIIIYCPKFKEEAHV